MSKIRKSARGKSCQVRLSVCRNRKETVILAHRNGYGIAGKNPDYQGAYCCFECHEAIDGRMRTKYTQLELYAAFCDGVFRTQEILKEEGLIEVK